LLRIWDWDDDVYQTRILKTASVELSRLDQLHARRIAAKIRWLAENFDNLSPESLKGDLAGFFKLRVGDYRVVYDVLRDEHVIVIHLIGHRRDVYRN
jgi:mRNA interferase RelE/StbE